MCILDNWAKIGPKLSAMIHAPFGDVAPRDVELLSNNNLRDDMRVLYQNAPLLTPHLYCYMKPLIYPCRTISSPVTGAGKRTCEIKKHR